MNKSNFTEGTTSLCIPNERIFGYVYNASFIVIGGLGVIGNIFIIILAAKYTEIKSLHCLIINMCVSDILIAILNIPELTDISLPNNTPVALANVYCKLVDFLGSTSELLTLTTLLTISTERYRATKIVFGAQPFSKLKLICVALLLSMGLSSFSLIFGKATLSSDSKSIVCNQGDETSDASEVLYFLKAICLILLYFSVFIISVATSVRLSKSSAIQANLSDEQRRRRAKRMINAVRMVLCSLLLYSMCYLPDFIEDVIKSIDPDLTDGLSEDCEEVMDFLVQILKVVNSCLSPLIYLVFLDDFRRAANKLICITKRSNARRVTVSGASAQYIFKEQGAVHLTANAVITSQ